MCNTSAIGPECEPVLADEPGEADEVGAIADRPGSFRGKAVSQTTDALPGSEAKIAEMVRRAAAGERLFDHRDRQLGQGQAFDRFDELREGWQHDGSYKAHGDVVDKQGRGVQVLTHRLDPGERDPAHTLAARLQRLRGARRWSLQRLARESGLTLAALSQLEHGKRTNPPLTTLERLADAFKISLDQLAGRARLAI